MPNTEDKRRGRPRRDDPRTRVSSGKQVAPTASGQITPDENEQLNELADNTGRTRSYLVRAAIAIMLRADALGSIDWSKAIEEW